MGEPTIRYANVDGVKSLPFKGGRAVCGCCGGALNAKCGTIVTHHWAHASGHDCDAWAEGMGPWHLSWQELVHPDFLEVARGPHRADILGAAGAVIELQHSPISAEDIAAREAFYGDMVWLFDATQRFALCDQGERGFFSVGRTKHVELCKKPVFLDFGHRVLEVERFTNAIEMVSGFGQMRTRKWFTDRFLSEVLRPNAQPDKVFVPESRTAYPWSNKSPVWKLKEYLNWIDPATGEAISYPKWTPYLKLESFLRPEGDRKEKLFDYEDVIDRHHEIANGWSRASIRDMKGFFRGTAILLDGRLRVLPPPLLSGIDRTVRSVQLLLELAEEHIQAGRLPLLEEGVRQALFDKAMHPKGTPVPAVSKPAPPRQQASLFDDLE